MEMGALEHLASVGNPRSPGNAFAVALPATAEEHNETGDFDSIYAQHFHEVQRWVGYLTGSAADADDLAQRVFEVVLGALEDFDGRNVRAWLYAIARRVAAAHRRRAWFRHLILGGERSLEFLTPVGSGDDALVARLTTERLLSKLSPKLRTAMILHEIEGYTAEEIAEIEGVGAATIHSRLRLARARFVKLAGGIEVGEGQ